MDAFQVHDTMGDNSERDKDEKPLSADFAALIEIIRVEGRAYRCEEQREDRGKKIREWITIGLLACTLSAVGWQVREMIKVYDPISKQAEASKEAADAATKQSENSDRALVQAQRAWVGPQNAAFAAEPAVGKPIETSIAYQNSGHEPALAFTYFIESFAIGTDQTSDQKATAEIQKYMQACKERKDWVGGSVIYPTNSGFGGGYTLTSKTKDDFVDADIAKGEKIIIVQGCFSYRTFNAPHHSYFCYFYRQGFTKIQNLNICQSGHDAD